MNTLYSPKYGSRIEHAIVRFLVDELGKRGFKPVEVYDGGDTILVSTLNEVLDAVFAVDDAWLRFRKDNGVHGVYLVGGNGEYLISDWNFFRDDRDGFSAAMDRIVDLINEGPLAIIAPPEAPVEIVDEPSAAEQRKMGVTP